MRRKLEESAWRKVFESKNDQAMITLTGLDYKAFIKLHEQFKGNYDTITPFSESGEFFFNVLAEENVCLNRLMCCLLSLHGQGQEVLPSSCK